jgi:hypothetical protein
MQAAAIGVRESVTGVPGDTPAAGQAGLKCGALEIADHAAKLSASGCCTRTVIIITGPGGLPDPDLEGEDCARDFS